MIFQGIIQDLTASAGSKLIAKTIESLISWAFTHGIKVIIILFVAWIIIKISESSISRLVGTFIEKSKLLSGNVKIQEERTRTLIKVFNSSLKIAIWVITFLTILPEFGVNPAPLLAGAGLVGLAIGMGSKNLVQDYLAGLFILIEDQYRIGEEVDLSGKKGKVTGFNLRRTTIKDSEGAIHYIPNGQIKITSNFSRKQ